VGVLNGAWIVLGLLGVLGLGVVGVLLYPAVDFVRFSRLRKSSLTLKQDAVGAP
jgi:hypothetical protein